MVVGLPGYIYIYRHIQLIWGTNIQNLSKKSLGTHGQQSTYLYHAFWRWKKHATWKAFLKSWFNGKWLYRKPGSNFGILIYFEYPFSTETMIYWKAFRIFPWPGCHCFEQTQVALKIPASWTCANRTVQKTVSQNCFWENHNVVQTRKKKRFGRCLKTKRVQQKKCSMWQWKKSQLLEVCILL